MNTRITNNTRLTQKRILKAMSTPLMHVFEHMSTSFVDAYRADYTPALHRDQNHIGIGTRSDRDHTETRPHRTGSTPPEPGALRTSPAQHGAKQDDGTSARSTPAPGPSPKRFLSTRKTRTRSSC